jgi:hypothetical protein
MQAGVSAGAGRATCIICLQQLRTLQEPANGLLNPCVVLLGFAAKWNQTVQAPAGACKLGRSVMKAKRNFDKASECLYRVTLPDGREAAVKRLSGEF